MSDPVFSIGIVISKHKAKKRVKKQIRKVVSYRHPTNLAPIVFRAWYILPTPSDRALSLITNSIGGSLQEARAKIKMISLSIKRPGWANYRLLGITEQHIKRAFYLCNMNERFRRVMTRLMTHWRKRHLVKANEEDLITMDPPVRRIDLYDWNQKRIYNFEASTIFRCITKRLTSHDGMFATPLEPVNPYTNMKLTFGQLHSTIEQLRSYNMSHWAIEALRNARYSWSEFIILHDSPLQMSAMRAVFSDMNSMELHDTLFDFIDAEYANNDIDMDRDMYRWLIKNAIESYHISQWRKLCQDFYTNQILYKDIPIKQKLMVVKIAAEASRLCRLPRDLYRLRDRMDTIEITGEA